MTDEEIKTAISEINDISGMTVNERLSACGLLSEFDQVKKKDKNRARRILEWLEVDRPSIEKIV
jgi:hypothetical protein